MLNKFIVLNTNTNRYTADNGETVMTKEEARVFIYNDAPEFTKNIVTDILNGVSVFKGYKIIEVE
jgi:uncharacterized protein (UPF0332 family)